jgi:hypothetical protein
MATPWLSAPPDHQAALATAPMSSVLGAEFGNTTSLNLPSGEKGPLTPPDTQKPGPLTPPIQADAGIRMRTNTHKIRGQIREGLPSMGNLFNSASKAPNVNKPKNVLNKLL